MLSFPANSASYCVLHHTHPSCNVIDLKLCLWSTTDSSRTLRTATLIGRCAPSQSRSSILGAVDHLRSSCCSTALIQLLLQHQYLALKLRFSLSERRSSILTELGLHLPGRPASAPPPSAYKSQSPHFLNAYFACGILFSPLSESLPAWVRSFFNRRPWHALRLGIDRPLKLSRHNSWSARGVCRSVTQTLFIRHTRAQPSSAARQR